MKTGIQLAVLFYNMEVTRAITSKFCYILLLTGLMALLYPEISHSQRRRIHPPENVVVLGGRRPVWACVPDAQPPVFGVRARQTRRGIRVNPRPRAGQVALRQITRISNRIAQVQANLDRLQESGQRRVRRINRLKRNLNRLNRRLAAPTQIRDFYNLCQILASGGESCELQSQNHYFSVLEGGVLEVDLKAESSCTFEKHFELLSDNDQSNLEFSSSGRVRFSPSIGANALNTSFRVCHNNIEPPVHVCSSSYMLNIAVLFAGEFAGDERSLAPYRQDISMAERAHLIWKVGSNRRDLLEGAEQLSLDKFVTERLMGQNSFAADLVPTLEEVRARMLEYPKPIRSEHFIPEAWRDFTRDNSAEDPMPVIPPSHGMESPEDIHFAFQRWVTSQTRSYHSGNRRYHWGFDSTPSHLFMRSRYLSPVHEKMMRFWLGHFGTSTSVISGGDEHYVGYLFQNIERNALGSFRTMMVGSTATGCPESAADIHYPIVCDAASQIWLDNQENRNDRGPNENFARESMELYLLSPYDEWTGLANYSDENDVQAATAFLSGFDQPSMAFGGLNIRQYRHNPGLHFGESHDMFTEWAQLAPGLPIVNSSLRPRELFLHIIDQHPGAARYIGGKIFSTLVYPDPDEALVAELGELLRSPEIDWHIGKFVSVLLQSQAMFSERARGRNCIHSPADGFLRVINGLQLPLFNMSSFDNRQLFYRSGQVSHGLGAAVSWAGERILNYPSVFSYAYCGRNRDIDGSSEWLKSDLNVFKVQGLIRFLGSFDHKFSNDYELADIRELIAPDASPATITPLGVVSFFETTFALELSPEERAVLLQYLTTQYSNGEWYPTQWRPEDAVFMRRKFAGLIAIMAGFQQLWM